MLRTLEGLLGNCRTLDSTELIKSICEIFRDMTRQKKIKVLRLYVDEPIERYLVYPNPGNSGRLSDDGSQHRVATVARIIDFLQHHSADDVFMHESVELEIVVNHQVKRATDLCLAKVPSFLRCYAT